jgi:hypothetical protein
MLLLLSLSKDGYKSLVHFMEKKTISANQFVEVGSNHDETINVKVWVWRGRAGGVLKFRSFGLTQASRVDLLRLSTKTRKQTPSCLCFVYLLFSSAPPYLRYSLTFTTLPVPFFLVRQWIIPEQGKPFEK